MALKKLAISSFVIVNILHLLVIRFVVLEKRPELPRTLYMLDVAGLVDHRLSNQVLENEKQLRVKAHGLVL